MLLTPCRATAIWNGLQVTQEAPTVKMTAGAPVCATELAQHPNVCVADSPVANILLIPSE